MKVLIIGSSKFPIPAVKGGAVPNLIEEIISRNEIENKIELECCSLWDEEAESASEKYKQTKFIWAKKPEIIEKLDKCVAWVLKNIFKINRLHSIGFLFQIAWFAFFVAGVLKNNDYDSVVFENSIPMLYSLKLYGNMKKYKDKYYVHMHSVPRNYYGNKRVFSNCKYLITISDYVSREIIADKRNNISEKQVRVMYNCIDTACICPRSERDRAEYKKKYGISEDKKVILFAGRLCKDKGIEEVIRCVEQIKDDKIVLVVVGSNFYSSGLVTPYEEKLVELSKNIKNRIIFTGYVDYGFMSYIYNMADVVVLPSVWEEPAGMTIIEAMACKKPVITTISGGIPEYTGEGNCILLHKDNNLAKQLTINAKRILSDKTLSEELAINGFKRAVKYSKKFYYEQFLAILKEEQYEKL